MPWLLRMRAPILAGSLGLLVLLLLGAWGVGRGRAADLPAFGEAPSFTLIDQLEQPLDSDELRGRVVVANFIFTYCTDICPLLSAQMRQLQERLRHEDLLGSQVALLSITVDPDRDTPAVLKAYAARHQADPTAWRFLTGPKEELVPLIVQGFKLGVTVIPPHAANHGGRADHSHAQPAYEVMHSGRFVLIDPRGQIRAYYDGREFDAERVARDIRQVLR